MRFTRVAEQNGHSPRPNHLAITPTTECPTDGIEARLQIELCWIECFRDVIRNREFDFRDNPARTETETQQIIRGQPRRTFKTCRQGVSLCCLDRQEDRSKRLAPGRLS
jgi:hypothetical protein